jgi:NhaP-type Na+/H+ or K+/H+ antiporter
MIFYEMVNEHNLCAFTSIIFLTNAILALLYEYYLYSLAFLILTITSIIVHLHNNIYTLLIDKIPICFIIFYGGYLLYKKWDITSIRNLLFIGVIVSTFLLTVYLYVYGYCTNQYCYNLDNTIGVLYHSILHLICCLGHNLIILL